MWARATVSVPFSDSVSLNGTCRSSRSQSMVLPNSSEHITWMSRSSLSPPRRSRYAKKSSALSSTPFSFCICVFAPYSVPSASELDPASHASFSMRIVFAPAPAAIAAADTPAPPPPTTSTSHDTVFDTFADASLFGVQPNRPLPASASMPPPTSVAN